MTTTTLGAFLPRFREDYGLKKKLDLILNPSHDMFVKGVKNAKPSGIQIE